MAEALEAIEAVQRQDGTLLDGDLISHLTQCDPARVTDPFELEGLGASRAKASAAALLWVEYIKSTRPDLAHLSDQELFTPGIEHLLGQEFLMGTRRLLFLVANQLTGARFEVPERHRMQTMDLSGLFDRTIGHSLSRFDGGPIDMGPYGQIGPPRPPGDAELAAGATIEFAPGATGSVEIVRDDDGVHVKVSGPTLRNDATEVLATDATVQIVGGAESHLAVLATAPVRTEIAIGEGSELLVAGAMQATDVAAGDRCTIVCRPDISTRLGVRAGHEARIDAKGTMSLDVEVGDRSALVGFISGTVSRVAMGEDARLALRGHWGAHGIHVGPSSMVLLANANDGERATAKVGDGSWVDVRGEFAAADVSVGWGSTLQSYAKVKDVYRRPRAMGNSEHFKGKRKWDDLSGLPTSLTSLVQQAPELEHAPSVPRVSSRDLTRRPNVRGGLLG